MKTKTSISSSINRKKNRKAIRAQLKRFNDDEESVSVSDSAEARRQRILLQRESAKQENKEEARVKLERANNVLIKEDSEENTSSKATDSDVDEETDGKEKKPILDIPESRVIVANVFRFLEQEYKFMQMYNVDNCNLRPLAAIHRRTAEATGVTRDIIGRVVRADRTRIAEKRVWKNQRSRGRKAKS